MVSVLVEVSQLDHAPWIDSIRRTTPGALLLGHGFLWGDLACYAVGVCLGVGVEVGVGVLAAREGRPKSHPADRTQDRHA